jgi:hypothetical protein
LHFQLPPWLGLAILLCVFAAALLKGGGDERAAAVGLVANVLFTALLRDRSWPHVQWTEFALDVLLLALLVGIALRSRKFWPLSAAAFQLLATVTHIAKMVDPNVHQWAYLTAIVIWTYGLIAALGAGVWNHWRAGRYEANEGPRTPSAEARR